MFEIYYFWENCKRWFSSSILSFKILIGCSFYLFGDLAEQILWGCQRVSSCSLPHPPPDHLSQGWITMILSLLVFVFLKRSLESHEFENSWTKLLCFFPPAFPFSQVLFLKLILLILLPFWMIFREFSIIPSCSRTMLKTSIGHVPLRLGTNYFS